MAEQAADIRSKHAFVMGAKYFGLLASAQLFSAGSVSCNPDEQSPGWRSAANGTLRIPRGLFL